MIMRAIAGGGGAAVGSQGGSGGTPNKGEGASSPSRKFVNLTSPKAGQNGGSPKKPKSPGKGTPASKDHTPHARWATSATPPSPHTHKRPSFFAGHAAPHGVMQVLRLGGPMSFLFAYTLRPSQCAQRWVMNFTCAYNKNNQKRPKLTGAAEFRHAFCRRRRRPRRDVEFSNCFPCTIGGTASLSHISSAIQLLVHSSKGKPSSLHAWRSLWGIHSRPS